MKISHLFGWTLIGAMAFGFSHQAQAKAKKAGGSGNITIVNRKKISMGDVDPQRDKREVNVIDKINGGAMSIEYRIRKLRDDITGAKSATSSYASSLVKTQDQLKSDAMSIKSEIDKLREDAKQYMMDGEITLNDRDILNNRLDGCMKMLADLRLLSPDDLKS